MNDVIPAGMGAATGALIGLAVDPIAAVVGAVLGGAGGFFGGRQLGQAASKGRRARSIDPFAVGEPWRHMVRNALSAANRMRATVDRTSAGPLKDRLGTIADQLDEGVDDAWEVAQRGHTLSGARGRLDVSSLQTRLDSAEESGDDALATSLSAQLESAQRFDAGIADTASRLELITTRLEEAAVRGEELSAGGGSAESLDPLASQVVDVVDSLEALRLAVDELGGPTTSTS